jgi:hypothetical protein
MKTVVSGVALAAILALAMPAWANSNGTHRAQMRGHHASMSHAKKMHATRGMHARNISHKNNRYAALRHRGGQHYAAHTRTLNRTTSPTDHMANQLNRSENQRLTGGSTPPMTGPNMAPPAGSQNAGNPNMAPMGAPNQPRPMQQGQ